MADSSDRIIYLDNLRSFAMLVGLLVHAAHLADFGLIELLAGGSRFFRMGAFFLISGFFASLLLATRTSELFLRQRLFNIVIPCLVALVVLNPPTLWLIAKVHNPDVADLSAGAVLDTLRGVTELEGPIVWHLHLWFLFSLTFFILTAPLFVRALQRPDTANAVQRWLDACPVALFPSLAAFCVAGLLIAGRIVSDLLGDYWLLQVTLDYWPYYLLGLLLYWMPRQWASVHRADPVLIGLAVLVLAGDQIAHRLFEPSIVNEVLRQFSLALARCAVIFALLHLFRTYGNWHNRVTKFMSQSIYSVYLFHYLVIYILAAFVIDTGSGHPAAFVLVVALTALICMALHRWLIDQFTPLRIAFNGRVLSPISKDVAVRSGSARPA